MKTPIEIIDNMVDEMPYKLDKNIVPYIKEALEIFGEQCFNAGGARTPNNYFKLFNNYEEYKNIMLNNA